MAFDMEEQFSEECVDSGIHEECGVFGAYDFDGNDIASTVYYGLFALQHRGQESCGIAVSDTNGPKKNIQVHKGMGLVHFKVLFRHLKHTGPGLAASALGFVFSQTMLRMVGAVIVGVNGRPLPLQYTVHIAVQRLHIRLLIVPPGPPCLIGHHHQPVSGLFQQPQRLGNAWDQL